MGYPGQLALLNAKDEKVVAAFIKTFNNDVAAKEWARAQSPTGASFARRSMLDGPVMKQLAKRLTSDLVELPSDLAEWCHDFWAGLLETVASERANKVIRDCATRDCPNKSVARTKRWESLQRSKLGDIYKRQRLTVDTFRPIPRDVNDLVDSCYAHTDPKPPLPFKKILDKQDWETFNSMSIRSLYAEAVLIRDAFRLKDATLFTESWRTAFLPAGSDAIT